MKRLIFYILSVLAISGCILENNSEDIIDAGDALPDFSVVMSDGSVVSTSSLKGSMSIVMFFHTSCPDCQQALPAVQRIYDEYNSKGVKFALISREEAEGSIQGFWTENGLEMPYSAQSSRDIYNLFATSRIPRIYISDENGIVRYIFTDNPVPTYSDLKSALDNLIR